MSTDTFDYCKKPIDIVKDIMRVIEELNHLKDVDTILDRILREARRMTGADAGTIYLLRDKELSFSYVHNDSLFKEGEVNPQVYADLRVAINDASIVGYVAMTGSSLNIDDAYKLPTSLPYHFNPTFDQETGYRTRSILTLPLKTMQHKTVGVMQLINAQDCDGKVVPFEGEALTYSPLFANHASVAIERGMMTRELILRMMKMAEMRDPSETGAHVQRVGAYTAEIYHKWARSKGVDELQLNRTKDLLRLAAMLHDVGKVGIPDAILKKPGRLTDDEFEIMRWHTVYGAALFSNSTSDLDELCCSIALNHHERWNGKGYPGFIAPDLQCEELCRQTKKGEEIPLPARITALADVYDALCSPRSYKDPWPEDRVLDLIREEKGQHFDPDVVDAFFAIHDTILAIKQKYRES